MAIYRADSSQTVSKRKRRIRNFIPIFIALIVLVFFGTIAWWYISRDTKESPAVSGKPVDLGTYNPLKTFDTEYFSFKAADTWALEEKDSKPPTLFVYRSRRSGNVEQELKIYVNTKPSESESKVVYVAPVEVNPDSLSAASVSDKCSTYVPKTAPATNPIPLDFEGAKYSCWRDNTLYIVGVSAVGGDQIIKMERRDGTEATYFIRYQDNRFSMQFADLKSILNNFQSR